MRVETKRLVALVLGTALVIVLAAFAISGDLGEPSIPDGDIALVQDAPNGGITKADYEQGLKLAAFNFNLQQPPAESDPQFQQVQQSALAQLLESRWVEGEAAEQGIEPSDRQIDDALDQLVQQQLGGQKGYQQFLKQSPYTAQDVRSVAKDGFLYNQLRSDAVPAKPVVSNAMVQDYYEVHRDQFTTPAQRDVREILNKDRAQVDQARTLLAQDDSAQNWKKVAAKYSTDDATKSQGGLRTGVIQGQSEQALDQQIFSAPVGELVGPFHGQAGWYLIEVEKATPEKVQPLDDQLTQQIEQQLQSGIAQQADTTFQAELFSKWRARTFCADGYKTDLCANGEPPPDNCPIDDPDERDQAKPATLEQGCEAPVLPRAVIAPGTGQVFPGEQPTTQPPGVQTGAQPQAQVPGLPGGVQTIPSTGAPPQGG